VSRASTVRHEFVDFVPEDLAADTLYISVEYATVVHLCLCGCGERVVTPLTPTDWELAYDGESVSLRPSIGNWSFDCQSHYWIRASRVYWSRRWSRGQIEAGRARDRKTKQSHLDGSEIDRGSASGVGDLSVRLRERLPRLHRRGQKWWG